MAVGLTVVLVMQDFDLSFGAMIGLAGGAMTTFHRSPTTWAGRWRSSWSRLMGAAAGYSGGFMVSYLGSNSFIITLAMGTILTGVEVRAHDQATIYLGRPSRAFLEIGPDAPSA